MIHFIFRERGREGEREGEKYQCVVASRTPPTGDLACNPGMCPDWEWNQRPFGLQASTQNTKQHQPGKNPASFQKHVSRDQNPPPCGPRTPRAVCETRPRSWSVCACRSPTSAAKAELSSLLLSPLNQRLQLIIMLMILATRSLMRPEVNTSAQLPGKPGT